MFKSCVVQFLAMLTLITIGGAPSKGSAEFLSRVDHLVYATTDLNRNSLPIEKKSSGPTAVALPTRTFGPIRANGIGRAMFLAPSLDLDELTARRSIIRTPPLPFDLDAGLRRRMTESVIDPGQRAVAALRKNLHPDRGLFIGRRVGHRIRMAARQSIDWTFNRVHRHIEFLTSNPINATLITNQYKTDSGIPT